MKTTKKKTILIISGTLLAICVASASLIAYLRSQSPDVNVYDLLEEEARLTGEEESEAKDTASAGYTVPAIKSGGGTAGADVIPDPADEQEQFPVGVTETVDEAGNVTQRPNWEDQKILAEDTDLTDPDTVPEYVNPDGTPKTGGTTSQPAGGGDAAAEESAVDPGSQAQAPGSGSPKNGDTKIIDGQEYGYFEGFGWVKRGSGNQAVEVEAPTTGYHVGY